MDAPKHRHPDGAHQGDEPQQRRDVSFHYSHDHGAHWTQHPWQMEVSGFHHNVFGGFLSLRVGAYAAGSGEVALRSFTYRGLE